MEVTLIRRELSLMSVFQKKQMRAISASEELSVCASAYDSEWNRFLTELLSDSVVNAKFVPMLCHFVSEVTTLTCLMWVHARANQTTWSPDRVPAPIVECISR